jgi:hypothetical protein
MFPETAGKPLEEVTAIFEDPHGIRYIGTPAWKTRNGWAESSKREHGDLHDDHFAGPDRSGSTAKPKVSGVSGNESSPERVAVGNEKV